MQCSQSVSDYQIAKFLHSVGWNRGEGHPSFCAKNPSQISWKVKIIFTKGPSMYYVSKRTGWVGFVNGQFFCCLVLYLCWHSGWVRKSPQIYWWSLKLNRIVSLFWLIFTTFTIFIWHRIVSNSWFCLKNDNKKWQ